MPRKAKPTPTPDNPPVDPADEILSEETYIDVQQFLESFGGSAVFCKIERHLKNGEREECDTIGFDEIRDNAAEYLRTNWGPGRFTVSLLTDKKRWLTRRTINIAARPMAPMMAPAVQPGGPVGFDYAAMLREQLADARAAAAADRQLVMQMITSNKGADIGGLLQGLGSFLKPPDPAAMFSTIVTAFQAVKGSAPEASPLSAAREWIALAKELTPGAPGEGGSESWAGVVKEVGGRLLDRLGPGVIPSAAPVSVRPAGAAPRAVAATSSAGEQKTMDDFVKSVREGIAFLRTKAKKGGDPAFWVDYLFEESAEDRFNAVIHAVREGATIEQLYGVAPEIAADPVEAEWFRGLYVGIKLALSGDVGGAAPGPDPAKDLDSAGAAGDTADAGNNAPDRKAG